jgi:hypothetical protein
MKKLALLALLALSFLTAKPVRVGPNPGCDPCPFVR